MTKIILVRHGHVEGISPERFRGRADLMLTPEGRHQGETTARRIHATWGLAAIYTSPLSRCRATGEAIGKPLGLSPSPVDGLIDIDYGEWQGLTPDEVRDRWPEPPITRQREVEGVQQDHTVDAVVPDQHHRVPQMPADHVAERRDCPCEHSL